jgi:ferredoxin
MTRVVVDRELCMSSGVCEQKDPVLLIPRKLGASLGTGPDLAAVQSAVRACPTGALQLVD